jgi:putative adhesin
MTSPLPVMAGRPLPMTAWRWVALVIGTPLALLAIGYAALTAVAWAGLGSYRVNLAVPIHGRITVVSVDSGDIRVGPGPAGLLRVHGTVRYSIARPYLNWDRSRSGIALHQRCVVPAGLCSFDTAVTVPASGRSEISDGSGDVTATGLAGTITLGNASGDIHATRISGSTTITDNSGDIVLTSLAGARVLIKNDSGDIAGTGVSTQVLTAQDLSGDISVVFTKVPQRVEISDDSGNITLVLPPGPATYRVSASTASGSTSIKVPRSPTSPHVISVTDQSGNITITR